MHNREGRNFATGKQLYTPKKILLHIPFPEQKKREELSFQKTNSSVPKENNKNKTKKKISFLLIFLLKLAFKPNKSQESQVQSQDYHNQNGENSLKEESIQH